ncbi:Endo-1,4-beta-xylanase 5 [Pleurotus ostreatus]|nr:Endo-1,4-beta-xylanase 5 [Pleurotus ostreatus]
MPLLAVQGAKIVDDEGNEIILRGAGLGGWMTMENFISGFPGCEYQIRESLADTIGKEKAEFFFQKFLDYFFAEDDARFFHSVGLNCIRIAISYRHFEDDMAPRVLKPNCFAQLDRVINVCAKYGIYTIIDMHTAPGGQNGGWHSDHGSPLARFWIHKDFQDRLIWLWEQVAAHYKAHQWIAGYNVLNEPADPHAQHARLLSFYDRAYNAIRAIDTDHIIFFDGNTYATDFTKFPDDAGAKWENTAFSIHDYSVYGFPKSPEPYDRTEGQRDVMRRSYERKRAWMDARGLCVWNGEWGPVYARPPYDGDATDAINQRRYNVLEDQLEIYNKDRLSWSIWLYKDIGFQGMVYVSQDTPYMTRFRDFLAKKYRMAVDSWGADDRYVKKIYEPIVGLIKEACPDADTKRLYPPIWSLEERVARYSRQTLVAEYLVGEWASIMKGLDEGDLEELAKSFAFENCAKREGLNDVLRKYAPEAK